MRKSFGNRKVLQAEDLPSHVTLVGEDAEFFEVTNGLHNYLINRRTQTWERME